MEEMQLLDAVERYLANEMPAEERGLSLNNCAKPIPK